MSSEMECLRGAGTGADISGSGSCKDGGVGGGGTAAAAAAAGGGGGVKWTDRETAALTGGLDEGGGGGVNFGSATAKELLFSVISVCFDLVGRFKKTTTMWTQTMCRTSYLEFEFRVIGSSFRTLSIARNSSSKANTGYSKPSDCAEGGAGSGSGGAAAGTTGANLAASGGARCLLPFTGCGCMGETRACLQQPSRICAKISLQDCD